MPLRTGARPFAISSCAITICCWRRSSSRSHAMRCIRWEARLSRWLLKTHDCVDGDAIPLTQEFLGEMLGVRRTTVTIAAQLLQSAGLIRYRRGRIQIVDRPKLEKLSCECYPAIRRYTDRIFQTSDVA